jgi:hypothetical protein
MKITYDAEVVLLLAVAAIYEALEVVFVTRLAGSL